MPHIRIQHRSSGFTLKSGKILNDGNMKIGQFKKETLGDQEK